MAIVGSARVFGDGGEALVGTGTIAGAIHGDELEFGSCWDICHS
jgi:hypothetical protein